MLSTVRIMHKPLHLAFLYDDVSSLCELRNTIIRTIFYRVQVFRLIRVLFHMEMCSRCIGIFLTQLCKMLVLATFFPASDANGFDLVPELMKASADIFDVMGLHAVIVYLMAGKSEVRFLAVGLGWAFAHRDLCSQSSSRFWAGARAMAFHWKYIQMALNSNIDLIFYVAMAALVWLFTRNDLRLGMRRIVALLIALCVFREFVEQAAVVYLDLRSWTLLGAKAAFTTGLAAGTLVAYSSLGTHFTQYRN
ncbi:Transmembrane protein [Dirofilaria immitis]|nr:Transmembrane protein [Dirofilaria immitis]